MNERQSEELLRLMKLIASQLKEITDELSRIRRK
jgi:hypothetical protein